MSVARKVFFVSDNTGVTIENMGEALLGQFADQLFSCEYRPFVDSPCKARELLQEIEAAAGEVVERPLIFSSVVCPEIRTIVTSAPGFHVNFFDAFLAGLEQELGQSAEYKIGLHHRIDDSQQYDERISSVDFSLNHDDGMSAKNLHQADVILMGVSRSGKTPTCLYLALNYGIRAANYPLTEEDLCSPSLPSMIEPYRDKVYGLTIDPERLCMIRQVRRPNSPYSDPSTCKSEVLAAQNIFSRYDIPFINVTHRSVEELSINIIQACRLQRRT